MSLLIHRWQQIRRVGPRAAARLAWDRVSRMLHSRSGRMLARFRPTGLSGWSRVQPPRRLVPALALAQDGAEAAWLKHEFDLLGSGPRSLDLAGEVLADLSGAWHSTARKLQAMLPAGYRLIDWQRDVKSGDRWSARAWSRDIAYGNREGVDVKWPWELSRLQHLPALAGRIATAAPAARAVMAAEIRAEIIDFVLQNPPAFGVNWVCAMDVGIRAANVAVAIDLARAAGIDYDPAFLVLAGATLRDHGRFLTRNLEWGAKLCSNHYLADVIGLLYVAAYLPGEKESRAWLSFAGREAVLQLRGQFHADGSNFEASTCYHRLSAEMMVYGAALMLHLAAEHPGEVSGWWEGAAANFHPPPAAPVAPRAIAAGGATVPFDPADQRRLRGMGWFTESLLRRDGTIPHIGDNDSGRFMRLGWGADFYADLSSHAHLPAAVRGLFAEEQAGDSTEAGWLRTWVGRGALKTPPADALSRPDAPFLAYREFGLYVWNRGRFRVTLRAGAVGQNGNGGHAHCDQLAVTLDVDGREVLVDPGTGIYTPYPAIRNRFRSSRAHGTVIAVDREQYQWLPGRWGLFSLQGGGRVEFADATLAGGTGSFATADWKVSRRITVSDAGVALVDQVEAGPIQARSHLVLAPGIQVAPRAAGWALTDARGETLAVLQLPGEPEIGDAEFSPHYGVIQRTQGILWTSGSMEIGTST